MSFFRLLSNGSFRAEEIYSHGLDAAFFIIPPVALHDSETHKEKTEGYDGIDKGRIPLHGGRYEGVGKHVLNLQDTLIREK